MRNLTSAECGVRSAEWKNKDKETRKLDKCVTIPALNAIPNIRHAFTTRADGLGARTGGIKSPDDWNAIADAFAIAPDKLVTVQQVHGDEIVVVNKANYRDMRTRLADGLVTSIPGI